LALIETIKNLNYLSSSRSAMSDKRIPVIQRGEDYMLASFSRLASGRNVRF